MRKVLVIGSGGAGKSTFALRLAQRLKVELIHLDALYWKSGWVETPKPEWRNIVETLAARSHWVMDGNYGGTLGPRLAACDAVVFLDLPRLVCIGRVLKRRLKFQGSARPDMNPHCPEQISLAFLIWIWTYPSRRKPEVLAKMAALRPDQRSVILKSQVEIETFLRNLSPAE